MKWSSFKDTQMLFENWRKFSSTPATKTLLEQMLLEWPEGADENDKVLAQKAVADAEKVTPQWAANKPEVQELKKDPDRAKKVKQSLENIVGWLKEQEKLRKGITKEDIQSLARWGQGGTFIMLAFADNDFLHPFGPENMEMGEWAALFIAFMVAKQIAGTIAEFVSYRGPRGEEQPPEEPPDEEPPTGRL